VVWTHGKRLGGLRKWSGHMTQPEESLPMPEIRLLITGSLLSDNKCSVSCCKQTVNYMLPEGKKVELSLYTPRKYTGEADVWLSGFGGLGVSVLAFGTQVCGFKPGRSRRIFKGEKILSTPPFGGEVKPSAPCRRFAARKRSQKWRGSRHFRPNYRTPFSPT
jgi:hypothetical protein